MASNFMRECIVVMFSASVVAGNTQGALGGEAGKLFLDLPSTHFDFGTEVDQIAVDDETGDVYVAGNNVLYHLDASLSRLETVTLDHTIACRCNNSVKVLEIEPTFRRLLVCATSKKGECVLMDLKNVTKISVLHAGNPQEQGFQGYRIVIDDSEEPFVHFVHQDSFTTRLVVASPNSIQASEPFTRSKPLLSVREIQKNGGTFDMRYVTTCEGQLQMNKFQANFQYYVIDAFCNNDMCYFITLQEVKAGSDALMNRLVTVCIGSLYPYVEIPLGLTKDSNNIVNTSRVVATALGKAGTGSGGESSVVVIIFGLASNDRARQPVVSKGYTIAVVPLSVLQQHVNVTIDLCRLGHINSPDWISGTAFDCSQPIQDTKCSKTEKMAGRQTHELWLSGEPIPAGNDTGRVVSVLTHTQVVDDNGNQTLDGTVTIFVVLSSGRVLIYRWTPALSSSTSKITYVGFTVPSDLPASGGPPRLKHDTAVTDEFYYLLTGSKVVKIPLDYCLEIQTCEVCRGTQGCGWCKTSQKCQLRNKNCLAENCPLVIENFRPRSGPTNGGTQLSLELTKSLNDNVTIDVCGQKCQPIIYIQSDPRGLLNCTVPPSHREAETVCNVTVTITSGFIMTVSASGYRYTTPKVESYEPPRMLLSERGQMRFHGENLDTGSNIAVILSPDNITAKGDQLVCGVTERNSTSVLCRLNSTYLSVQNDSTEHCYAKVEVRIDDAQLGLSGATFCRYPEPEVTRIEPLFTFESGGSQLKVEGRMLNTTGFPHLAFLLPANQTGKKEVSQKACKPCPAAANGTCLLCCLPDLVSPNRTNESFQVGFTFKAGRVEPWDFFLSASIPVTLTLMPDPQFTLVDPDDRAQRGCQPMGEHVMKLKLKSHNLPENTTLQVWVGGRRCATEVDRTSSILTCNLPTLASTLKTNGILCPDRSVCGEDICEKNFAANVYPIQVETSYRMFNAGCVNLTETEKRSDAHWALLVQAVGGAAGGCVVIIVLVVSCVLYVKYQKRKFRERYRAQHSLTSSSPGSAENTYQSLVHLLNPQQDKTKEKNIYASKLLIQRKNLTLGNVVGHGNFGCVLEGSLRGKEGEEPRRVAVKTLLDPVTHAIDLQGFIDEALLMKNFNHEHVLGLLGLAEGERGLPLVVLPFMERGDLLTYVKNEKTALTVGDVMRFASDIASGMDYLSGLKFVHRDLAARNCMLDSELRVKVADFGLCRDIYEKGYYHSDNKKKLPIRWMAMESIEKGTYTSKSDVWSMGVVLWELTTRGTTPYPGVEGWDILRYLAAGRRLEQPLLCPDSLYALMDRCWQETPFDRPSFKEMEPELQTLANNLQQPDPTDNLSLATPITFPQCRRYRADLFFAAMARPADNVSLDAAAAPSWNESEARPADNVSLDAVAAPPPSWNESEARPADNVSLDAVAAPPSWDESEARPAVEKMADVPKREAKQPPKPKPRPRVPKKQQDQGVKDSKPKNVEAANPEPPIELKETPRSGRKTVRKSDGSYYVLEI